MRYSDYDYEPKSTTTKVVQSLNYCHILTIVFVILKLTKVIDWNWWLVLLPSIIDVGVAILFLIGCLIYLLIEYHRS